MTPAIMQAKKAGIKFDLHSYEHDPAAQSYGLEAADKMRVDPDRVFKTLVAVDETGALIVGIVPVSRTLNPKALAAAARVKRVELAELAAAERATGYVAGGISPLGQKKRLRTVIDDSAQQFPTIFVSAGRRGLEIELSAADLMQLTSAVSAKIST